jgi:hypothetical protein
MDNLKYAKGTVPLLGFEGENYGTYSEYAAHSVLFIPVKHYRSISIYAWSSGHVSEGYNIFFPSDCPVKVNVQQVHTPFDCKMIVQDYLNQVDHFRHTGELPTEN